MSSHLRFRYRGNLEDDIVTEKASDTFGIALELDNVTSQSGYLEHLLSRLGPHDEVAKRLVAYFGESWLFHDWAISRIELSPDGKRVTLEMDGCSIDDAEGKPTQIGQDARFTFVFHDVVWFANELRHRIEHAWLVDIFPSKPRTFQYAEVDSLDELLAAATTRYAEVPGGLGDGEDSPEDEGITDFHSLLIQHCEPDGMLGIVFRYLQVTPAEPLAWQMLLSDPRYSVPLMTRERLEKLVGDSSPATE